MWFRAYSKRWYAAGALIFSLVVMGPLLRPLGNPIMVHKSYWLWADAVSTPRTYLNAYTLGFGDAPPRAVPQDWFLGLITRWIDGGFMVCALTLLGLIMIAHSCARIAALAIDSPVIILIGEFFSLTNPFINERLHQGQWSLVVGLGGVCLLVAQLATRGAVWIAMLGLWFASFTVTSSIFAAIMLLVCGGGVSCPGKARPKASQALLWLALIGLSLPWLIAGLLRHDAVLVETISARLFSPNSDGTWAPVSIASLAGIWNMHSLGYVRSHTVLSWLQSLMIIGMVVGGMFVYFRSQRVRDSQAKRVTQHSQLMVLAIVTVGLVIVSTYAWPVIAFCGAHIPGAGVLRDSSKFLGLAIPGYVLAICYCLQVFSSAWGSRLRWGLKLGVLCAGIGSLYGGFASMHSIQYPSDFARVAEIVNHNPGPVVSLPQGLMRSYAFNQGTVSLDPLPRMMRSSVSSSNSVSVDGRQIDQVDTVGARREQEVLHATGRPSIGDVAWVIAASSPGYWGSFPQLAQHLTTAYSGPTLQLYKINDSKQTEQLPIFMVIIDTLWSVMGLIIIMIRAGYAVRERARGRD